MVGMLSGMARGRRGLTLIEILIALIILMVGLVGIFALFPVGIKSTQESVEDSNAALIAESIHHALIAAMRASPPAPGGTRVNVVMCHDGLPGQRYDASTSENGQPLPDNTYVFWLPSDTDRGLLMSYPIRNSGTAPNAQNALFRMAQCRMGAPQYIKRCLMGLGQDRQNASNGTVWSEDASEALDQYFVGFDVQRVQDQAGGWSQPLFEFRIGVYRNYIDRGTQGWGIGNQPNGGGGGANWATVEHPDRKKVFRTLIAGN